MKTSAKLIWCRATRCQPCPRLRGRIEGTDHLDARKRPRTRAAAGKPSALPGGADLSYGTVMARVYSARVRGGVVVPDGVMLPEGTAVTVAVNDERDAEIELTPAELAELDDAIADADRSQSVSSAVVLAELDRIARAAQ
jgi:hypothetical protein